MPRYTLIVAIEAMIPEGQEEPGGDAGVVLVDQRRAHPRKGHRRGYREVNASDEYDHELPERDDDEGAGVVEDRVDVLRGEEAGGPQGH
jgi:hypothetical protein